MEGFFTRGDRRSSGSAYAALMASLLNLVKPSQLVISISP
jgi:hypothetical protein